MLKTGRSTTTNPTMFDPGNQLPQVPIPQQTGCLVPGGFATPGSELRSGILAHDYASEPSQSDILILASTLSSLHLTSDVPIF